MVIYVLLYGYICVIVCVGCYCEDHEDEEGVEAPAASGRSSEPAVVKI